MAPKARHLRSPGYSANAPGKRERRTKLPGTDRPPPTRADLNSGKPWSKMDVADLRAYAPMMPLPDFASYLMRSRNEVSSKAVNLGIKIIWKER